MNTRRPNPQYLGDAVYASHDGTNYLIQTCDGYAVNDLITMTEADLDAFRQFRAEARQKGEPTGNTQTKISDEVQVQHNGHGFRLIAHGRLWPTNAIHIDGRTAEALEEYREYCAEYFGEGQDQVTPDCEECGADISRSKSPVHHAVAGEIYKLTVNDRFREIRLCYQCGTPLTSERVNAILASRESTRQKPETNGGK